MNASVKRSTFGMIKPLVLAVALTLPAGASMAAAMSDVVRTRADQTVDLQYGRDSVYAFAPQSKPLVPAQQSSDANLIDKTRSFAGNLWDKTRSFAGGVRDWTAGWFRKDHEPGSASQVARLEPEPYGRAGGYVGPDRITVLESNPDDAIAANSTVDRSGHDWAEAGETAASDRHLRDQSSSTVPGDQSGSMVR